METINPDLLRIALDKAKGAEFEQFVNDFMPSMSTFDFVPLGGTKDGGADAFEGDQVYERRDAPTRFYQSTVQEDFRSKIRKTVARLRQFGRATETLIYCTSRSIRLLDQEEEKLSDELDIDIRIRGQEYFAAHLNDTPGTVAAFNHHLRHLTDFLKQIGSSKLIPTSAHVKSPAVYVFLEQELSRRRGDVTLLDAVSDSLALWALEGTDPDLKTYMSSDDVVEKVSREIPAVRSVVCPRLARRLQVLSGKKYPGGRQVRWHKSDDVFVLPYETRLKIEAENLADETLRLSVLTSLYERASSSNSNLSEPEARRVAEVTLRALQMAFEKEGVEFSTFLHNSDAIDDRNIADFIKDILDSPGISSALSRKLGSAAFSTARQVFMSPSQSERAYLEKLSRTYTLLFTLNAEPRLLEYFQQLAGQLNLYVGSDLIVSALSERYLPKEAQTVRRTLQVAASLGAKLVLTDPVLEEIVSHLRATDLEFKNHHREAEPFVTEELAHAAPRILIRSYLLARLDQSLGNSRPRSWETFLDQFCTPIDLHRSSAFDSVRRYLQTSFGMTYKSSSELETLINDESVKTLTDALVEVKSNRRLARNDALMALAIYGERARRREDSKITEFGFETWWLTGERSILRHTRDLVTSHRGVRYIMRPDFILNFVTLAPSALEARETLGHIFPSALGVTIGRHMSDDNYRDIMENLARAADWEDARRSAAIVQLSDRLKADYRLEENMPAVAGVIFTSETEGD